MAPTKLYAQAYIELLKTPDRVLRSHLIERAPISILKVISNAALEAAHGGIHLTNDKKKKFRSKRKLFQVLTSKKTSWNNKKQALIQKGGISFLPLLLGTVLSAIGPALFGGGSG